MNKNAQKLDILRRMSLLLNEALRLKVTFFSFYLI